MSRVTPFYMPPPSGYDPTVDPFGDLTAQAQIGLLQQMGFFGDAYGMGGTGMSEFGPYGPNPWQIDPQIAMQMLMLLLMQLLMQGRGHRCPCRGNLGNHGYANSRPLGPGAWGLSRAAGPGAFPMMQTGNGRVDAFMQAAMSQNGDRYIYGAEASRDNANPHAFDCSELVEWSAAQAGINIPDGAHNQYNWTRQHGTEMSVEQALRTPGALLFRRNSSGRVTHVAISRGDGTTIEARGSRYGVGVFNAAGRFNAAGYVPGMHA